MNVQKQLIESKEKAENIRASILLCRKEIPRFLTKLTKTPYVPLSVEEVRTYVCTCVYTFDLCFLIDTL